MKRATVRKGFTLIEVLVVAAILVILAGAGVVAYTRAQQDAKINMAKTLVADTCRAVELYQTKMDALPTTEEGLNALCKEPADEKLKEKWNTLGPFLKNGVIPKDPWDNELKYELVQTDSGAASTGPAFHVWSLGPDKQDGTADDIKSWTEATAGTGG